MPIARPPRCRRQRKASPGTCCWSASARTSPWDHRTKPRWGRPPTRWVKEMDGNGVRLFGSQLEDADQARTVRIEDDQVLVTDGPFAGTKEQIVGFDIVECADLDEALEVAAAHPMARFGMLEVRPFWPFGAGPGRSGLGRSG